MPNTRTEETMAADTLLNLVNNFGIDEKAFAKRIASGHKTLQQSVMRLFMTTIKEMSQVMPDDRNAATVALAKRITEMTADTALPFI